MFDEKIFIAQVEQAQADEFADIMTRPSAEQEKALRAHLGDHRYQRMHAMALRGSVARAGGTTKGNVVVLHGSMGSELSLVGPNERTQIWVHALRLMDGQLSRLRLAETRSGRAASENIHATGIMKRHYGELLLTLAQQWSVRAFWYDWRRGVEYAALRLQGLLVDWFDERDPIHFVAHGLGGLVVRALIQRDPARWALCRPAGEEAAGGRLVMLGTPHHGSFTVPQLLAGIDPLTRQLARLDRRHDESEVQAVVSSFAGLYEMLPSPLRMPGLEPLFQAETYAPARVSQRYLDAALAGYKARQAPPDDGRLVQVVGHGQPTLSGLDDPARVRDPEAYQASFAGDGRVLLDLAELETSGGSGQPVRTYYVEENHGTLTANEKVLNALDELLETGVTSLLDDRRPAESRGRDARAGLRKSGEKCATNLLQRVERLRARATRDVSPGVGYVTFDERVTEELITRDVLSSPVRARVADLELPPPGKIELAVEHALIHKSDLRSGDLPIDAIAVGHYEQVKPAGAELQLDQAISGALGQAGPAGTNGGRSPDSGILTQYTERGIIRGELGQPFFLPDPRVAPDGPGAGRLIVLAGMGAPGRFGAPELTVLARELCWSLGRMGKKHLATLLIGAGYGNLAENEAVEAWVRGIKHAVSGSVEGDDRKLQRITFIEADGAKIRRIQDAILEAKKRLKEQERLEIEYERLPKEQLDSIKGSNLVKASRRPEPADPPPTRITYSFHFGSFRFGAITQDASIPEREIPLDGNLVEQANNELAAEWNPAMQLERGRFVERLLIPRDLRDQLSSQTPIVLSVDATTARIHWELVAQPEFSDVESLEGQTTEPGRGFLGTARGLTRQLRSTFAPPPEPPPPAHRVLRVLVVADPAEDAPLRGAQEEGVEVADLFAAFNVAHGSKVESKVLVTALLGPREATRTNVLRHLMLHSFDVLHFAGHSTYNPDTRSSGWLFSDGELVTANELNRIDRIPKFVFSNSCESGITPDRSEQRSVDLAPNFAESFFARGVSNFVCTAWPVEDVAARMFAMTLYRQLLGLSPTSEERASRYRAVDPEPMHLAMQRARQRVAEPPFAGSRTWGSYQHYGNPYFRLFQPSMLAGRRGAATGRSRSASRSTGTKAETQAETQAGAPGAAPAVPSAPSPARD
jgi:hypothetical protein